MLMACPGKTPSDAVVVWELSLTWRSYLLVGEVVAGKGSTPSRLRAL